MLLLTLGEPAGIGPDIIIQLAQNELHTQLAMPLVCISCPELLRQRAQLLQLPLKVRSIQQAELADTLVNKPGELLCLDQINLKQPQPGQSTPGVLSINTSQWVLDTIQAAAWLALSLPHTALVTGPVQKSIINDAGIAFSGHTEYLADICNAYNPIKNHRPLMMLTTGQALEQPLRVALVTTHHPLYRIPALITQTRVLETIVSLHHELENKYQLINPRLLITGLNPHAGEAGHLGREEIEAITPAVLEAQAQGINIIGPLPADTLFTPHHLHNADAVIAMYHDQGLPVLKYAGFGQSINVTLGLPLIRTSVDHGTALDRAGKPGQANSTSLLAALLEAEHLLSIRQESAS